MKINEINKIAKEEGWSIFECYGSEYGFLQIQKIDDDDKFRNDIEAITFVLTLAISGSQLHKKAMNICSDDLALIITKK